MPVIVCSLARTLKRTNEGPRSPQGRAGGIRRRMAATQSCQPKEQKILHNEANIKDISIQGVEE